MRGLLQSGATGQDWDYRQALAMVAGNCAPWRRHAQPRTLCDVILLLMEALAGGYSLTLYDGDFSSDEIRELTGADTLPEETEFRRPVSPADWSDWKECVARNAPSGFLLGLFTSGSSGLPKRVEHNWDSLSRGLRISDIHGDDVWGFTYNPTHIAGVQVILQALLNGNQIVDLWRRSHEEQVRLIETAGVTHLSATPSFYRLLLPLDRPNLRVKRVSMGGEGSDEVLRSRLHAAFPNAKISNIYASTEAGSLFVSESGVFKVPALLCDKVRVRDGCLELHCSLLADFTERDSAEWYATGDRVDVVSNAPLTFRILGRERDWLNVGGAKVNPHEVESVLLSYPGVTAVRVSGRPNSVLGTLLQAEVVIGGGVCVDEYALRTYLGLHLQAFKVPRLIKFVPALDHGRTGKLMR